MESCWRICLRPISTTRLPPIDLLINRIDHYRYQDHFHQDFHHHKRPGCPDEEKPQWGSDFSCPGSSVPDLGHSLSHWVTATLEFQNKYRRNRKNTFKIMCTISIDKSYLCICWVFNFYAVVIFRCTCISICYVKFVSYRLGYNFKLAHLWWGFWACLFQRSIYNLLFDLLFGYKS